MTLEETKTMLIMIAAAYPNAKYPKEAVQIWHDVFKVIPAQHAIAAVKEHISTSQWEPKISELLKIAEKQTLPPSLLMTPSEALALAHTSKLILVTEARAFADKSIPPVNGQYANPEELALACRIRAARWEREFKERFEYLQNLAKSKVHLGIDPKAAILGVRRSEIAPSHNEAKKLLAAFA